MQSTTLHIGFIGLGLMGKPMALNLQAAGHRVFVNNRSTAVVEELSGKGLKACASPAEVAGRADVVILMLPDTATVDKVLFGEFGLFDNLERGQLVVDMGTTDVTATRGFAKRVESAGAGFIDAPVSGGQIGAEEGSLAIMVGARASDFERVRPIFEILGKNITHVGEIGAGQVAKAANQGPLPKCCGVDASRMQAAFQGGFAWSRIMEVHGRRMIDEQFEPGGKSFTSEKGSRAGFGLG